MHPKLTPLYSCNKRKKVRRRKKKKTEEMKSCLYTSGNNHTVWVREWVIAVLPEYHRTLLKNQTNTKSSLRGKKRQAVKISQPL